MNVKIYIAIGGALLLAGFVFGVVVGRDLHWQPPGKQPSAVVTAVTTPDAGAVSTATASCDAGVVVIVTPGRTRWLALPTVANPDAGVSCPACPEVKVEAYAGTLARSDAPIPTPEVVTRTEYRDTFKVWGVGIGGGWEGKGVGTLTIVVQPAPWLQLEAQGTTGPGVNGSLIWRF